MPRSTFIALTVILSLASMAHAQELPPVSELGLAGAGNAREKPRVFWAMILLVLAFVLFLGFIA